MQSLNKNGVSITQTPGEEKFVKCCLGAFRGQIYYQYDYRHTDGELFSTVAKTLLCLAWRFTSVAGAGTAITAYIVFCAARFLLRVCLSALYALGVALLFLLLLSLLIL